MPVKLIYSSYSQYIISVFKLLVQCGLLVCSSDSVHLSSHLSVAHFLARCSCVLSFPVYAAASRIKDCTEAGPAIILYYPDSAYTSLPVRPLYVVPVWKCRSCLEAGDLNTFFENSFAGHSFRSAKISIFEKISSDIDSFLTMFQRFFSLLIHYLIKMSVVIADVAVFVHVYCVFLIIVNVYCEFVISHMSDIRLWSGMDVSLS